MRVGSSVTFADVYKEFKQSPRNSSYGDNKHLRFNKSDKDKGLYLHEGVSRPRIFDWFGSHAKRRAEKQADAGQHVWQSIANQHGKEVANRIFKNVLRSTRSDHRTAVTLGDLERIRKALPQEAKRAQRAELRQGAVQLASDPESTMNDLDRYFSENLESLSSKRFEQTMTAKFRSEQFHTIRAFARLDRMTQGKSDSLTHDFDQFLAELGMTRMDVPEEERHLLPGLDEEGLREETKNWMADQLHEKCFKTGGDYQLNLESGSARKQFSDNYTSFSGTADEKLQMLKTQYHTICQRDVGDIAQATAEAVTEMGGDSKDVVSDLISEDFQTGLAKRKERLQQQRCSLKNRQLVRKFLPGTKAFNKVVENAGWKPSHLMVPEKRYIADRLRGMAALEAQNGREVDVKWADRQIKSMLKGLEEPRGKDNATLPELQRQAKLAADSLLNALLDPQSESLSELNNKVLDFQEKSARLTHARKSNFGPEDVQEDHRMLLQNAAQRLTGLSHLDPMAKMPSVLHAAYLAMADKRTDQFAFHDNSRSSKIAPQMSEFVEILRTAVKQIQHRKGEPDLNDQFERQRQQAENAAKSPNRINVNDLGVSRDSLIQSVNNIVQRGLEAVERREERERQESVSVYKQEDLVE